MVKGGEEATCPMKSFAVTVYVEGGREQGR